jgi:aerotolerance regulator-like protein
MRLLWLTPLAWLAALTIVVPIAIHLLTKQQTRLVPFPTLRFLHPTRLSALARRFIHEWLLLSVRVLILLVATAAFAAPLFVFGAREAAWHRRTARAFAVTPGVVASDPELRTILAHDRQASFTSAVFRPAPRLADAMRDATTWLGEQAPGSRELVIVGDVQEGSISDTDIASIAATIGIRFREAPRAPPANDITVNVLARRGTARATISLTHANSRITIEPVVGANVPIRVFAPTQDQPFASAALEAVLAQGIVVLPTSQRRLAVVFAGAAPPGPLAPPDVTWMRKALARLPGFTGGQSNDMLVVDAKRRANDLEAVHALDVIVRTVFEEDLSALEPNTIPAETIARWTRATGFDPGTQSDEGDRRWLWAAVLVLLALETILRRSSRGARVGSGEEEARVA